MKYLMTTLWGFLLVNVLGYVGNSMIGSAYDPKEISILAIPVIIALIFVATVAEVKPQTEN